MVEIPDDNKLLLEVELKPVQGQRFQPTGFPSLGPAEFTYYDGDKRVDALLVESAQSMAKRLGITCLDDDRQSINKTLNGMPHIIVNDEKGDFLTNSILESHRMNSPYILYGKDQTLRELLEETLGSNEQEAPIQVLKLAKFALKYDPNSIIHGAWIVNKSIKIAGGRYRMTRVLSSFIEASGISPAVSGGVKIDNLDPKGGEGRSDEGLGHVPYSRTEYCAESVKVYFNIDIALIKSYNLGDTANNFLFTLALWKIRRMLDGNLRLRTACDFKTVGKIVTDPSSFSLPDSDTLDNDIVDLIKECADENHFGDKSLVISYEKSKSTKKPKAVEED